MMMTAALDDVGESYPDLNVGYTLLRYLHHFCVLLIVLATWKWQKHIVLCIYITNTSIFFIISICLVTINHFIV